MAEIFIIFEGANGLGHGMRTKSLANAFLAAGDNVTLLTGSQLHGPKLDPRINLVKLPDYVVCPADSLPYKWEGNKKVQLPNFDLRNWQEKRADRIADEYHKEAPDAIIVEFAPYARKVMDFEINMMREIAYQDTVFISSLRDVMSVSEQYIGEEEFDHSRQRLSSRAREYDRIFVHGDNNIIPFGETYPHADLFADKIFSTGYVGKDLPPRDDRPDSQREVLVSIGSGQTGAELLRHILLSRLYTPFAEAPWRIIAGPRCPEDQFEQLWRIAETEPGVVVEKQSDNMLSEIVNARFSVNFAGYNTMMEVLQAGIPAVMMPAYDMRTHRFSHEQAFRLDVFADRGLLTRLSPINLINDSWALGLAMYEALDLHHRHQISPPNISFDGARNTVDQTHRLINARRPDVH